MQPLVALVQAGYRNRFGHPAGDEILREVVRSRTAKAGQTTDAVARFADNAAESGFRFVAAQRHARTRGTTR